MKSRLYIYILFYPLLSPSGEFIPLRRVEGDKYSESTLRGIVSPSGPKTAIRNTPGVPIYWPDKASCEPLLYKGRYQAGRGFRVSTFGRQAGQNNPGNTPAKPAGKVAK